MRVGEKGVAKAKPKTRIKRNVEAHQQIRREGQEAFWGGPESRTGELEHNRKRGEEHEVGVSSLRAGDKMRTSRKSWRVRGRAGEQEDWQ